MPGPGVARLKVLGRFGENSGLKVWPPSFSAAPPLDKFPAVRAEGCSLPPLRRVRPFARFRPQSFVPDPGRKGASCLCGEKVSARRLCGLIVCSLRLCGQERTSVASVPLRREGQRSASLWPDCLFSAALRPRKAPLFPPCLCGEKVWARRLCGQSASVLSAPLRREDLSSASLRLDSLFSAPLRPKVL